MYRKGWTKNWSRWYRYRRYRNNMHCIWVARSYYICGHVNRIHWSFILLSHSTSSGYFGGHNYKAVITLVQLRNEPIPRSNSSRPLAITSFCSRQLIEAKISWREFIAWLRSHGKALTLLCVRGDAGSPSPWPCLLEATKSPPVSARPSMVPRNTSIPPCTTLYALNSCASRVSV